MVARLRTFTLATLALVATSAAKAADYSPPMPPPVMVAQPAPQFASGWYLRGNVGAGINGNVQLDYLKNPANPPNNFHFEHKSIADTFFIGGGAGYEFNNWLRFDGTLEYRAKSRVYAIGSYTSGGGTFLDTYEGNLSSWLLLANAYVDLGTWNCFTPFIGAGIGGAYNTLHDFSDVGIPTAGRGFGRNPSEWNLAWALYAGVAYEVTKNFKVEMTYRYLNYGSITDTVDCVGGCHPDSYKFGNLTSNDIMLGLRWTCCDVAPPPPPVVYAPPPLRSRG
ncbi:MAG TPA: outer membrane beta-barrel protein [Pseudolabrys sp.]|nr:outer membrane beta-barrel protein [Pseudolabrys sp.]